MRDPCTGCALPFIPAAPVMYKYTGNKHTARSNGTRAAARVEIIPPYGYSKAGPSVTPLRARTAGASITRIRRVAMQTSEVEEAPEAAARNTGSYAPI